jgi:hypothetical protein
MDCCRATLEIRFASQFNTLSPIYVTNTTSDISPNAASYSIDHSSNCALREPCLALLVPHPIPRIQFLHCSFKNSKTASADTTLPSSMTNANRPVRSPLVQPIRLANPAPGSDRNSYPSVVSQPLPIKLGSGYLSAWVGAWGAYHVIPFDAIVFLPRLHDVGIVVRHDGHSVRPKRPEIVEVVDVAR